MSRDSVVQDVKDFLDSLDLTKKGNLAYYSNMKRELSWLCGYEAVGIVPPDLYDKAEKHLIRVLEI